MTERTCATCADCNGRVCTVDGLIVGSHDAACEYYSVRRAGGGKADMGIKCPNCGEVRQDCEKGATTAATADAVSAMRHAVKEYKADCHRYAERAFEDIDRARGLIEERSYFKAADALYEAITDVHKAFLMGEIGLTYEECAGWREEDGDRHAD